jgi:hypothetical protein
MKLTVSDIRAIVTVGVAARNTVGWKATVPDVVEDGVYSE